MLISDFRLGLVRQRVKSGSRQFSGNGRADILQPCFAGIDGNEAKRVPIHFASQQFAKQSQCACRESPSCNSQSRTTMSACLIVSVADAMGPTTPQITPSAENESMTDRAFRVCFDPRPHRASIFLTRGRRTPTRCHNLRLWSIAPVQGHIGLGRPPPPPYGGKRRASSRLRRPNSSADPIRYPMTRRPGQHQMSYPDPLRSIVGRTPHDAGFHARCAIPCHARRVFW